MNEREVTEFLIGAAIGAGSKSRRQQTGAELRDALRGEERETGSGQDCNGPALSEHEKEEFRQVIRSVQTLAYDMTDEETPRARVSPTVPASVMRWAEYFGLRMFVSAEAATAYLQGEYENEPSLQKRVIWARTRYFEWLISAAICDTAASFREELRPLDYVTNEPWAKDDGTLDDIPF